MARAHSFWMIVDGGTPTAFRGREREDLLPTLVQLQRTQPAVELVWFERGRTWPSREAARAALEVKRAAPRSRNTHWRPGGNHVDPRAKYEISRDEKRARFKKRLIRHGAPGGPAGPGAPDKPGFTPDKPGGADRRPPRRDARPPVRRSRASPGQPATLTAGPVGQAGQTGSDRSHRRGQTGRRDPTGNRRASGRRVSGTSRGDPRARGGPRAQAPSHRGARSEGAVPQVPRRGRDQDRDPDPDSARLARRVLADHSGSLDQDSAAGVRPKAVPAEGTTRSQEVVDDFSHRSIRAQGGLGRCEIFYYLPNN